MSVTFQKMHGAGNDFVLLDLRTQAMSLDADRARSLADRKTGIGCDQLLVLRPADHDGPLARFEVWNADGGRAEQCGNGVRCIGLYLESRGETPDGPFSLQGPVAEVGVECLGDGQVRVDMGSPGFDPGGIPLALEAIGGWYQADVAGCKLKFGAVSMGNPHALAVVDDIQAAEFSELGPALSTHPAFPRGCNAGFAQVLDRNTIRLRVFERGAGETLACGSGACAAVAVLISHKRVDSEVKVIQAGGELIIGWNSGDGPLYMTGPAVHVFEGIVE